MNEGYAIIERIEKHCGQQIKPKRLRFQIVSAMQREIDQRIALENRIAAVLDGFDTYNPITHKPIRRSR